MKKLEIKIVQTICKVRRGKKTYNSRVCVKWPISNEFEIAYYGKLEEVIEL